ncbi:MAG: VOC family protein [Deinococcales bacterium]
MQRPLGLHHITAISGNAEENLAFYYEVLGMRLVKRSVNQDDPGTYHLFYADGEGSPGTDLTFFPWAHMKKGRKGVGITDEVLLAVPAGSLAYWQQRLSDFQIDHDPIKKRFGENSLSLRDPHGMELALVELKHERSFSPWAASSVPADKQVVGLHGARVLERSLTLTGQFLTEHMGFMYMLSEEGWHRYSLPDERGYLGRSGMILDVKEIQAGRGECSNSR